MRQAASTGVAGVDQVAGAGRDAQLVAGVTAVAALGPQRSDQPGLTDGPEEPRRRTDHLRGSPHRVGGVIVVVEPVGGVRGGLRGHLHLFRHARPEEPGAVRLRGAPLLRTTVSRDCTRNPNRPARSCLSRPEQIRTAGKGTAEPPPRITDRPVSCRREDHGAIMHA